MSGPGHNSDLKGLFTEALPLVEEWISLRDRFAALRDAATDKGFDWGQIKALAKAHVEDAAEGTDKRVRKLLDKADFATTYADMLGLGGKFNFSAGNVVTEADRASVRIEIVDPKTGEITDNEIGTDDAAGLSLPDARPGEPVSAPQAADESGAAITRDGFMVEDLPDDLRVRA